MHKDKIIVSTILVVCSIAFTPVLAQDSSTQSKGYEFMSQLLNNSTEYTLEVLEAMPADQYDFKPVEEVRTFAAQAFHIAYSMEFYISRLKGEEAEWNPGDENRLNKEELIEYVKQQFGALKTVVVNADQSPEASSLLMSFTDHHAHHRGQMIAYLRMSGIEPPSYR